MVSVKEQLEPILENSQQSKWIEDLNRSPTATQSLEEKKIGNLDNDLLDLMPREQKPK